MKVLELIQKLQEIANKQGDVEVRVQITNHPDVTKLHVTGSVNSISVISSIYINAKGDKI